MANNTRQTIPSKERAKARHAISDPVGQCCPLCPSDAVHFPFGCTFLSVCFLFWSSLVFWCVLPASAPSPPNPLSLLFASFLYSTCTPSWSNAVVYVVRRPHIHVRLGFAVFCALFKWPCLSHLFLHLSWYVVFGGQVAFPM